MATTLELKTYATVPELAEAVRRDGFAYMPGVLSADESAHMRDLVDEIEPNPRANDRRHLRPRAADGSDSEGMFYEVHTKLLFNRHAWFLQFLDRAPVADVADAVMGDDCHSIGMTGWITAARDRST
jgi:hypothetical protein